MRLTLNFTPAALPPFNRLTMRAPPKRPTPLREGGWVQKEQSSSSRPRAIPADGG